MIAMAVSIALIWSIYICMYHIELYKHTQLLSTKYKIHFTLGRQRRFSWHKVRCAGIRTRIHIARISVKIQGWQCAPKILMLGVGVEGGNKL